MSKFVIVATLTFLPFLSTADNAAAHRRIAVHAPAPRYSQEKLDSIRRSLVAQIAVRDDAEVAMRAPTPQEAAAIALASGGLSETIALANGGVALRSDGSQLSLAIAQRTADGTVRIIHGATSSIVTGTSAPKGATDDH